MPCVIQTPFIFEIILSGIRFTTWGTAASTMSVEEVDQDGKVVKCLRGGYVLVFKFVRMDGTCTQYPAFCELRV